MYTVKNYKKDCVNIALFDDNSQDTAKSKKIKERGGITK